MTSLPSHLLVFILYFPLVKPNQKLEVNELVDTFINVSLEALRNQRRVEARCGG